MNLVKMQANLEEINRAIEMTGGLTSFSLKVNISYQTALNWKHGRRTPAPLYCSKIEEITEGIIKKEDILPGYPWGKLK